jgi:O-antigen/teichoic acid export membrane protein
MADPDEPPFVEDAELPAEAPPPRGNRKLLTDYFFLIGSRYLGMLVGAVRGFLVPGLLDPAAYGSYKTLLLIPPYARAGHLGTVSGLSRQIPFFRGQKNERSLQDAVQVAYTFSLGSALLACLFLGLFSFTLDDRTSRIALLIFLVYVVTEQQIAFRDTYLVGFERFGAAAKLRLMQNLVGTALAVAGAWAFGLLGLIVATAVSGLINLTVYRWVSGLGFPGFRVERKIVTELVSIGAPMLVTGLLFNVFFTVDRIVIVKYLGAEQMGYYALAVTFVTYINDLSTLLSRVIFPRLVVKLAAGETLDKLKEYVHLPMAGTSLLFPFIVIFVHYFCGTIFQVAFPKYVKGADALEIMTFSILAYSHTVMYMGLIVALKRQLGMMWIYPVATAATAGLSLLAVHHGLGIEGVAGATVAGFLVLSVCQCFYAERFLLRSQGFVVRVLRSYGPTFYLGGLILGEHLLLRSWPESFGASLVRALLVTLLYLPLPLLAYRHDQEFRGLITRARRTKIAF